MSTPYMTTRRASVPIGKTKAVSEMRDCKECENLRREIVNLKGQIADLADEVEPRTIRENVKRRFTITCPWCDKPIDVLTTTSDCGTSELPLEQLKVSWNKGGE